MSDMLKQNQAVAQRQRSSCQALAKVLSIEPIHGEEALSVRSLAVGDVADNAGMAKFRQKLRLAGEALPFFMPSRASVQQLEGDGVPAVAVGRPVDRAHPAAAGGALDLNAIGKEADRPEL